MKISIYVPTLIKPLLVSAVSLLSLPVLAAYGDPFEGSGFVSEDWQLVCDNTLTCRAAGYSSEIAELRGSIMMTLPAGEKLPTTQVVLNYWDDAKAVEDQMQAQNRQVELWLNDKYFGKVPLNTEERSRGVLTTAQTKLLIDNARKPTKIEFRIGDYRWQISDIGMAAVLLKLDEVQGRVGTPSALVSKHNPNRQNLKPAKAPPKIYAAKAYPIAEYDTVTDKAAKRSDEQKLYQRLSERYNQQWQSKMTGWVKASIASLDAERREDCNILSSDQDWFDKEDKVWRFTPIDSKHTLASHPCWTGAYNFGTGYWLIDNDKPAKPKLITLSGSSYAEGEIFAAHKGRGLGDCWSMKSWVWDGKDFALASEKTTGLCRLIEAGGAWQMPTYVSEVIKITDDKLD